MRNIICFGAGAIGRRYVEHFTNDKVLAFADNDADKWNTNLLGHKIIAPAEMKSYSFDRIIITIDDLWFDLTRKGVTAIREVYAQLLEIGVDPDKIELQSTYYWRNDPRVDFLRHLSELMCETNVEGAIAECGVYRGHFSAYMNEFFPERKLYLFDTFEGFKEDDLQAESSDVEWLRIQKIPVLAADGDFLALLRCRHRENVIIKKGQVPHTLAGCEDERFAFVNLDMNLYELHLSALRFFASRMSSGGVILMHDYYMKLTPGIKQSVDDFSKERKLTRLPIGDDCSMALLF